MAIVSNLDLIRRVPLFSDLTAGQSSILYASVDKKRFKRGENIVEQGKISGTLFMILSGKVRVLSQDARGREVIMATLEVGDCIGEMSLIDGEPHSATVRAEVQTDVLTLNRETFLRCLHENASMADAVMRGLVRRLRRADKQIESLALMDVYGRVHTVLLEMAQPDAEGQLILRQKVSRQDVAKMVGASREMVSRVMKHFEDDGTVVDRGDGTFLLTTQAHTVE
ncbi:MAG: Crp/Fnr family transcriptional regulator [Brachymonas denitrificans]|jgi:CRP/FNR family cyclic AMP-dependent transcriptional regulator|uniref:Crp/Fnr family transcriptional regulator n=1 Tax=Brachymonas denitrificans TaxID=28220 RepID=UPI001BCABE28|nr:Crp/Fnr family transcriptional regulator [Brachymonas denitrificans]